MFVPEPSHCLVFIAQGRNRQRCHPRQPQRTIRFLYGQRLTTQPSMSQSTPRDDQPVDFLFT
jgi:hypothetical protein